MIIRNATLKDAEICHKLGQIKEFELPNKRYMNIEFFKSHAKKPYFIVAVDEKTKKIIGYAVGDKYEDRPAIQLWYIMVDKKYRGQGIGDRLLKEFEDVCIKNGVMFLILYAQSNNKRLLQFYRHRKFDLGHKYVECIKKIF